MHLFKTHQFLPTSMEEAWNFFSTSKNLARITPPELDFKIISKLEEGDIYNGMTIDYTVKPLFGIPIKWKTVLKDIIKNKEFTDIQLKGPYKVWEHRHVFEERDNGVLMHDIIRYQPPFDIGNLINKIFIRSKIENIFSYRKAVLDKLFCYGVAA